MLLVFSANTQTSLQQLVTNYSTYLKKNPDHIADLSYTLAIRREKLPFRTFSVAKKDSEMVSSSILKLPVTPPSIAMVFSGQGAQWAQMGCELMRVDKNFQADILDMDNVLQSLLHPPQWSIEGEIHCFISLFSVFNMS